MVECMVYGRIHGIWQSTWYMVEYMVYEEYMVYGRLWYCIYTFI